MSERLTSAAGLTPYGRAYLRKLGLTSIGVIELYEQTKRQAEDRGCECGVLYIVPRLVAKSKANGGRSAYDCDAFHAETCPVHPARAAELAEAQAQAEQRPLRRLKRKLSRR